MSWAMLSFHQVLHQMSGWRFTTKPSMLAFQVNCECEILKFPTHSQLATEGIIDVYCLQAVSVAILNIELFMKVMIESQRDCQRFNRPEIHGQSRFAETRC
jgi:hypothetical protein